VQRSKLIIDRSFKPPPSWSTETITGSASLLTRMQSQMSYGVTWHGSASEYYPYAQYTIMREVTAAKDDC